METGADVLRKLGGSSRQSKKGLPKRVARKSKVEKRHRSWLRTQEKKAARRTEQKRREEINRRYRARGEKTPAEQAYLARKASRESGAAA